MMEVSKIPDNGGLWEREEDKTMFLETRSATSQHREAAAFWIGCNVPLVGLLGKTQQHARAKTGSYDGEGCLGGDMEACAGVLTRIIIHMHKRNEQVAFADTHRRNPGSSYTR
nr:hypothetical protein Itr_chr12CG05040 [Ipomoea trifida]GMD59645.1 hypothetical protein Iba_chr12aCG3470 [Ipomoea batatas]